MPKHTTAELLEWVKGLNESVHVSINKNRLEDSDFWIYDEKEGVIRSRNNSFFTISGLRLVKDGQTVLEQPIIIQDEIGYLGIISRDFEGETHYLMQAKIEPGNINKIQISPTIQATKSNFTQKHGGKKPSYFWYFTNAKKYDIIVDQVQSEQSSRFLKKRNRNIIIRVDEDIEVLPSHKWMTLKQIKELMRYDNLVNMDTLLSEEGGRFYHEQNRNVIIEIKDDEIKELPAGYFWANLKTLSTLVQVNNCLNIQLRNLLSVLEW